MAGLDPRLRKRQDTLIVRAGLSRTLSNAELLAAFARSLHGKMEARTGIPHYVGYVADVLAYVQHPDGSELHVSEWRKETVWEYVHYVEANYCRSLRVMNLERPRGVMCDRDVWVGVIAPEEATPRHCGRCKLFQSSGASLEKRLQALVKFWKFLFRSGVVEANFVRDILSEWRDEQRREGVRERRRNPSVEEMKRLVNGTTHPRNRAFYAASAKWWLRPNEMLMLDRYASLGAPAPEGTPAPAGFERGFLLHQDVRPFHEGGDLAYLPETKGALDKRRGNRWIIIDDELRPILEQYLAWWERTVRRDHMGRPLTTTLWLTERGNPLQQETLYRSLFYDDCERLGLMTHGDRKNRLRAWTAHCQRHFGEKLLMMQNCPDTWSKHFRGDAVKDARGAYFVPTPHQIRQKYHELVPHIGFTPLPEPAAITGSILGGDQQREAHRLVLWDGARRVRSWRAQSEPFAAARIVAVDEKDREVEEIVVLPRRYAPSFLFALRASGWSQRLALRDDHQRGGLRRSFGREALATLLEDGSRMLQQQARPAGSVGLLLHADDDVPPQAHHV